MILRQRPSTAKGITFVTLEDETGTINLVVKPQLLGTASRGLPDGDCLAGSRQT